jgi:hypothetical protein
MGVTSMFIASKFEDIQPLKMKMVYEKIAHRKLPIERIKQLELEFLKVIHYKIASPTILDFMKVYLKAVFQISECEILGQNQINQLIFKMSVYLGKMAAHDYQLSGKI